MISYLVNTYVTTSLKLPVFTNFLPNWQQTSIKKKRLAWRLLRYVKYVVYWPVQLGANLQRDFERWFTRSLFIAVIRIFAKTEKLGKFRLIHAMVVA
jgi:hypothetical protein